MKELQKLSEYIVNLEYENLPKEVIEVAKTCILESFAVGVGTANDELLENVIQEYKKFYTHGDVKIWSKPEELPVVQSIFINALMGHRLELDDVHTDSKTHIGTVVVPVALTLGQWLKLDGKKIIEGVVCGYEIMSRIGMALGVTNHRDKGWHVTSTAGTFGAAACASKLLGLNEEQTSYALGMAGTQSFGLWAFLEDGASSKILHPARAATNGLEAGILAKAGMSGPISILDAKDGGLLKAMSDEHDISKVASNLGNRYEILYVDRKPYPCCRSTHCAIDAAIRLKEEKNIKIKNIESILVKTYMVGYKQCGFSESSLNPESITEAKFSTPYTVARALERGTIDLEDFKEDSINIQSTRKLMEKISVEADKKFSDRYPDNWGCEMTINLISGEEYQLEIKDALGSVNNPLTEESLIKKVTPFLETAYTSNSKNLIETIMNIEKLDDISELNL